MTVLRPQRPEYKLGLRFFEESGKAGVTVHALMEELGLSRANAQLYLRLWKGERKIHIIRWQRSLKTGGQMLPVWALGSRRDAPKPKPLTKAQIASRWREKNRATDQVNRRVKRGTFNPFQQLLLA